MAEAPKDLHLDSLEIKNFRAFKHLLIEHLGRVNLIVGKNNVGKTCLLEALWLYASGGQLARIGYMIEQRREINLLSSGNRSVWQKVRHLFAGRPDSPENVLPTEIKPASSKYSLRITIDITEQDGMSVPVLPLARFQGTAPTV